MKSFKIFYDEEHEVARVEHYEVINADDARQIVDRVVKLLEGKKHRYMIQDVSRVSMAKLDKETRKVFAEAGERIQFEKVAMVGADPMTRMITKAILAISGDAKSTKFFKTDEEAHAWLTGDAKR